MDDKQTEKAQEWLNHHPIEIEFDDGLADDQVSMILEGKLDDLYLEISEFSDEYIIESAPYILGAAISELDLGVTPDELWQEVNVTHLINLDRMIGHTKAYIAVGLDIDHYTYSHDYDDLEGELELLGINPREVDPLWPDIPGRKPLISAKSLLEVWHNATYEYGEWHALLDAQSTLELFSHEPEALKDSNLLLKAGANLTTHDHWNGSTSMIVPTINDWIIDPEKIYNDGMVRYGIQKTCGLVRQEWNGVLERMDADD